MNSIKPLSLAISTSSFSQVMDSELVIKTYQNQSRGVMENLDDKYNLLMQQSIEKILAAFDKNTPSYVEFYHSVLYDSDKITQTIIDNINIPVWSVHSPYGKTMDPSSPNKAYRKAAIKGYCSAVDLVSKLGGHVIVAHPGTNNPYDEPRQERLQYIAECIKEISDYALTKNIGVALEPLPKQEPGNTLDEIIWVLEKADCENLGINFDVNHLFPAIKIPEYIRKAGSRILSVHISDQDDTERHWLPFDGILDWLEVLKAFVDANYCGPLVYETHVKNVETFDDVARVILDNYNKLIELLPLNSGR